MVDLTNVYWTAIGLSMFAILRSNLKELLFDILFDKKRKELLLFFNLPEEKEMKYLKMVINSLDEN